MRAMHVICLVPKGDAMVENSLSSGCWERTSSFEWRPPLPEAFQATAPARVAFHPTCGRPGMGRHEGKRYQAAPYQIRQVIKM